MNCNATITVFELFGSTIHTRQAATEVLQAVADNSSSLVELDFENVDYISRSFADQFHANKMTLAKNQGKAIIVTNASEEVIRMFQAVASTQNKVDADYEKVPIYNYTDWKSLESFLLSV